MSAEPYRHPHIEIVPLAALHPIWHGWADYNVASMSTVALYASIRARSGAVTSSFLRVYMLPGVAHCGGGDGPDRTDLLTALLAWREDDQAPGTIAVRRIDPSGKLLASELVAPYKQ